MFLKIYSIDVYMVFTVILVVFGLFFYSLNNRIPFFKKHRTTIAALYGAACVALVLGSYLFF